MWAASPLAGAALGDRRGRKVLCPTEATARPGISTPSSSSSSKKNVPDELPERVKEEEIMGSKVAAVRCRGYALSFRAPPAGRCMDRGEEVMHSKWHNRSPVTHGHGG